MTKEQLINSLEIRVQDNPYFIRLYGLIAVERYAYDKAAKTGLPKDNDFYKISAAERRGFEMCLRVSGYSHRQIQDIHDQIRNHINDNQ